MADLACKIGGVVMLVFKLFLVRSWVIRTSRGGKALGFPRIYEPVFMTMLRSQDESKNRLKSKAAFQVSYLGKRSLSK